jgi:hypothetical protein
MDRQGGAKSKRRTVWGVDSLEISLEPGRLSASTARNARVADIDVDVGRSVKD